jgi:CheY-like chemotaxis protein
MENRHEPRTTATPTTILIVDDQPDNREMLSTLLAQEGYRTLTAAGGMEAMDSIANDTPQLILLDVSMPDMDGYAVASLLKADPKTSGIPIIMVTAHAGAARAWSACTPARRTTSPSRWMHPSCCSRCATCCA